MTPIIEHFDFRAVFRRDCQGVDTPGTPTRSGSVAHVAYEHSHKPPTDTPDSDYELWSPSYATDTTLNCVLGEHVQYVRRKQESQCFNGEDYEIATNVSAV